MNWWIFWYFICQAFHETFAAIVVEDYHHDDVLFILHMANQESQDEWNRI